MEHSNGSPRVYFIVFLALLVLLAAAIAVAYINIGAFSLIFGMMIAITKALLIILFFMHVRWSSRLVQIFVGAGFLWLLILAILTMSDYLNRSLPS